MTPDIQEERTADLAVPHRAVSLDRGWVRYRVDGAATDRVLNRDLTLGHGESSPDLPEPEHIGRREVDPRAHLVDLVVTRDGDGLVVDGSTHDVRAPPVRRDYQYLMIQVLHHHDLKSQVMREHFSLPS